MSKMVPYKPYEVEPADRQLRAAVEKLVLDKENRDRLKNNQPELGKTPDDLKQKADALYTAKLQEATQYRAYANSPEGKAQRAAVMEQMHTSKPVKDMSLDEAISYTVRELRWEAFAVNSESTAIRMKQNRDPAHNPLLAAEPAHNWRDKIGSLVAGMLGAKPAYSGPAASDLGGYGGFSPDGKMIATLPANLPDKKEQSVYRA